MPKFVYEQALGLKKLNKPFYFVWKCFQKIFYFWPRPFSVIEWAQGGKGKLKDPADFIKLDDATIQTMVLVKKEAVMMI